MSGSLTPDGRRANGRKSASSRAKSDGQRKNANGRGVLLINLGTPDRCDVASVRTYLNEFLADPSVIRLPRGLGWLNVPLGRLIALFRAPSSCAMYRNIWTENGSPLRVITEEQAQSLEEMLPRGWQVYYAMRYGKPSIWDALRSIEDAGIEELVVVPMYPQYSDPTTGTAMRLVYDYLKRTNSLLQVTTRTSWFDDHGYINAQAELIEQYAKDHRLTPEYTHLVFSTHGLPISYVKRGDPYPGHVARTVALVAERLGWPADRMTLAYQSRFGPVKWMEPYTDELLTELSGAGEKQFLVCPISFTTDCLETLEELDIQYREIVEKAGAQMFLCPALNTFEPFLAALKHLVLRGPQPTTRGGHALNPTRHHHHHAPDHQRMLDSFVMLGLSTRGRVTPTHGPALTYVNEATLRLAKRSQCEVPDLLRKICSETDLEEAWLWNTCHRFELYGWLESSVTQPAGKTAIEQIQRRLFEDVTVNADDVNILIGADAWKHLMRTAVGLNSGLPGERDVLEQFQAAHRLAERAGTVGSLTRHIVDDVLGFERQVRQKTAWGRYAPDYTNVALAHLVATHGLDLPESRIVVIGGSTTSAGVLRTLREDFGVPSTNLTLLYRGHKNGGHLKVLRKAIGSGRRLRVHSYDDPTVVRAMADADVVIFGIDRNEPVIDGPALRKLRDFGKQPLTIFDFNIHGSTTGLDEVANVTLFDAARLEAQALSYAECMCHSDDFGKSVEAVETCVATHEIPLVSPIDESVGRSEVNP